MTGWRQIAPIAAALLLASLAAQHAVAADQARSGRGPLPGGGAIARRPGQGSGTGTGRQAVRTSHLRFQGGSPGRPLERVLRRRAPCDSKAVRAHGKPIQPGELPGQGDLDIRNSRQGVPAQQAPGGGAQAGLAGGGGRRGFPSRTGTRHRRPCRMHSTRPALRWALANRRHQGGMATISQIRHHSYPDGTRLVLHMDGHAPLKYDRLRRPDRLYIDILDSRVLRRTDQGREDRCAGSADFRRAPSRRTAATRPDWCSTCSARCPSTHSGWPSRPGWCWTYASPEHRGRPARWKGWTLLAAANRNWRASLGSKPSARTSDGKLSLTRAMGLKSRRIVIDAGPRRA